MRVALVLILLAVAGGCGRALRAPGMTSCPACRTECPQKITCAKDGRCAGCDTCPK